METVERIEELKEIVRKQKQKIKEENASISNLKVRCTKLADLICQMNTRHVEEWQSLSSDNTGTVEAVTERLIGANDSREKLLAGLMLSKNKKIWPHIQRKVQINLREQLWGCRVELQWLENKMRDGTRPQLRKWSQQMEQLKECQTNLEKAILAVESWEKIYLMYMDDMDIRRESGMDEQFYRMECQDIGRKMSPCQEFYRKITDSIENAILLYNQALMRNVPGDKEALDTLPEEMKLEIEFYAIAVLFLEEHIYKQREAAELMKSAKQTIERLEQEHEFEKKRISYMKFAY